MSVPDVCSSRKFMQLFISLSGADTGFQKGGGGIQVTEKYLNATGFRPSFFPSL